MLAKTKTMNYLHNSTLYTNLKPSDWGESLQSPAAEFSIIFLMLQNLVCFYSVFSMSTNRRFKFFWLWPINTVYSNSLVATFLHTAGNQGRSGRNVNASEKVHILQRTINCGICYQPVTGRFGSLLLWIQIWYILDVQPNNSSQHELSSGAEKCRPNLLLLGRKDCSNSLESWSDIGRGQG